MKIINLSYQRHSGQRDAAQWISNYGLFYGIWEAVAARNEVQFLEFIDANGQIERNGITYHFQRKNNLSLLFPFALHRFLKKQQPDVVVVHGMLFPLQVILLRRSLGKAVKIIVQHHAEKPLKGWRRRLQPLADKHVDAYFFTAWGLAESWMEQGLISHRSKVYEVMETTSVFHILEKTEARKQTGVEGGKNYLWVGRLNDNKDPLLLLRSFIRFIKVHSDVHLYMIYHTEELLQEIKQILEQDADAIKQIHLVGKVPHEQLLYWYNSVAFIVSCSHYEGSGVAVCEAMSCGCIPLVTAIPSFQFMTGGVCGQLFAPGSQEMLEDVLTASYNMDIEAERLLTLNQYRRRLSPVAIAAGIQEILDSL